MESRPTPDTPVGTPVHLDFRKFDGSEHWQEDYKLLGVDDVGIWVGMRRGTTFARPGTSVRSGSDTVRLLPAGDARWAACFNAPGGPRARVYVDITTPVEWSATGEGFTGTLIDVDLDVVEFFTGETFIDDEDEFADHQQLFGYSADLVAATRETADTVLDMVRQRQAPFDGTGEAWLGRLPSGR